jgi:hypothetical protein
LPAWWCPIKVLCFFEDNGIRDTEILELHVVEIYKDEYGKKQRRGFVFSKHGVVQIDTALIPKASLLETLAVNALMKTTTKQHTLENSGQQELLQIKSEDWS